MALAGGVWGESSHRLSTLDTTGEWRVGTGRAGSTARPRVPYPFQGPPRVLS